MANEALGMIVNDCIDRLAAGQSVADCLKAYPQNADELLPLLETGQMIRRVNPSAFEVVAAQASARIAYERALLTPRPLRYPLRQASSWAASLALIFLLLLGSTSVLAESSLPGDFLFGFKLWTEAFRLRVSDNAPALATVFEQRRIDEAQQLIVLRREAEVHFVGRVEGLTEGRWQVATLPLIVTTATEIEGTIQSGNRVMVQARSTANGDLLALQIRLLNDTGSLPELATITPTSTQNVRDVLGNTRLPPSATRLPGATATATESVLNCVAEVPAGWVAYRIQAGDSLTDLIVRTNAARDVVLRVNCINNPGLIVVGQLLYLPRQPLRDISPTPAGTITDTRPTATAERPPDQRDEPPTPTPSRRS